MPFGDDDAAQGFFGDRAEGAEAIALFSPCEEDDLTGIEGLAGTAAAAAYERMPGGEVGDGFDIAAVAATCSLLYTSGVRAMKSSHVLIAGNAGQILSEEVLDISTGTASS